MHVVADEILLNRCKRLIEEKLGWGTSDIWTNQDFENLSEEIEKSTGIRLSVATLKRIWGKVRYDSKPTITTLDTLARFVDVENWRVFKLEYANHHSEKSNGTYETANGTHLREAGERIVNHAVPRWSKKKKVIAYLAVGVVIIGMLSLSLYFKQKDTTFAGKAQPLTKEYFFESRKIIASGIPNSVIFSYDASAADMADTIFIQQSWDERLREKVNRNGHVHTSIYYYPGYFQAKLVVNDRIVKEHPVYIQTDGWLPVVEQPDVPVYFTQQDIFKGGMMTLPIEKLKANSIPLQPQTPWVSFFNMRNFGSLATDNFIFETAIKNEYGEGAGICQHSEIHIRLEGGLLMIPLAIKGCVSSLKLFDMKEVKEDPAHLGVAFDDWVHVRFEVRNRQGVIYINDEKAYDMNLDRAPVRIAGLQFRFQGTGSVKFVRFSAVDGEVVYEDDFVR